MELRQLKQEWDFLIKDTQKAYKQPSFPKRQKQNNPDCFIQTRATKLLSVFPWPLKAKL